MNFLEEMKYNFDEHKSTWFIVSTILNIILIILCIFIYLNKNELECICENNDNNISCPETENIDSNFYVEVKGEVNNPGVYEVSSNNIINDIITMSGGFTKSAYTSNINLSKKVSKELVIYVYSKNEYKKIHEEKEEPIKVVQETCVCPSYDISNCTESGVSEIISSNQNPNNNSHIENNETSNNKNNNSENNDINKNETGNNEEETKKLININTATKEELITLDGIGDSKAEKIIEYRNEFGLFKSIEDIQKVNGIGPSVYEKIKDNITI